MPDKPIISITISQEQQEQLRKTLASVPNGAPRAIAAAINKTVATGRSLLARAVGKEITLRVGSEKNPKGTISEYVRRTARATPDRLVSDVRLDRKGIPLYEFSPRQQAAGVSVLVRKSQGRKTLAHTFLARMKSGHIGIFERRGYPGKLAKRFPIDERYGPTPLGVFIGKPGLKDETLKDIQAIFEKNLASQVNRLLNRKKTEE